MDPLRRILRKPIPSHSWLDAKRMGAVQRDPFHKTRRDNQFLSGLSHTCLTRAPLPMVLHWEDRNSMAHSIESRAPFLDYRLVEFTLGLPDEFKIQSGKTKRVLRESMKGILPEAVRTRTGKIGLATSEEFWLKGSLRTDFEKQLDDAQEVCEGFLTPRGRAEIENVLTGAVPFNFLPWRMVSLGQWARMFKVSFG
jgi:asparagine synthase (glutamine-hydrolysing)